MKRKRKIKGNDLVIEEDLNVVRSAGFRQHKRRKLKMNENRRAGLNYKKTKKSGEGVTHVSRRKPLALKHKRRIIKASTVLGAVVIVAVSIVGLGFFRQKDFGEATGQYYTAYYETPTDGSKPTDHSGLENIGYMNYVLSNQPYWSSEMHGTVSTIISQQIATYKQYYDGVLVSADITTSSMVNSAKQFCVHDDVVLWRDPAGGKETWNGMDTKWSTGKPSGMTKEEYRKKRGCIPNEFSVYIINENTILSCSEVKDNGNGTYSQTFKLNPATDPGENSAIYYYKYQMAVTGGLTELPTFDRVSITYTFDDNWRIIRSNNSESYTAVMGVPAGCNASSTTYYSYDEASAQNSYYEDYFKDYEASFVPVEEEEVSVTAASCLSNAFSSVLEGEARFAVDVNIDGQPLKGLVYLNLGADDVRVQLGNIGVYLTAENDKKILYISYGDGVKAKADLGELSSVSAVSEDGEGDKKSVLDTDELLSQLGGGVFEVAEDGASASLDSVIELFGFKIPLGFTFNIGDTITLGTVSTALDLLGSSLEAELCFTDEMPELLTDIEKSEYVDLEIGSRIMPLVSAEALGIDISYKNSDIYVDGTAVVNLKDLAVKADLRLVLKGDETSAKNLSLIYADEALYLALSSEGGEPIKLKADVNEAYELISSLMGSGDKDIKSEIMKLLEGLDIGGILNTVLADGAFAGNITLTDGVNLRINGTNILSALGIDFDPGMINATIEEGSGAYPGGRITLSALGADIALEAAAPFSFDEAEYGSAKDILPVAKKIIEAVNEGGVNISGKLGIMFGKVSLKLNIENISVSWADGLNISATLSFDLDGTEHRAIISYDGEKVAVIYDNIGATLEKADFDEFIGAALDLYGAVAGEVNAASGTEKLPVIEKLEDIASLLGSAADKDIFSIINSLGISGDGNGRIRLSLGDLSLVLSLGVNDSIAELDATYTAGKISVALEDVTVGKYSAPEALPSDTEYFSAEELADLLEGAKDVVVSKGVTLSGGAVLDIKGKQLSVTVNELSVSWADGLGLFADISVNFGGKLHSVYISYGADGVAVVYDNVGVKLAESDFDGFIDAALAVYNAVAAQLNENAAEEDKLPEIDSLSAETLKSLLPEDALNVADIVNGLSFAKSEAGNLGINYGALSAELVGGYEGKLLGAKIGYASDSLSVDAEIAIGAYASEGVLPSATGTYYLYGAKITPVLAGAARIINEKRVSLSGAVSFVYENFGASAAIDNLTLDWSDGISFALNARLNLGGGEHDVYASFKAGKLTFVYADVGLTLDFADGSDDITVLQNAVTELYNRIVGVVNTVMENDPLNEAADFSEILAKLGLGEKIALGASDIIGALTGVDKEASSDIFSLISGIALYKPEGEKSLIGVSLGTLDLQLFEGEKAVVGMGLNVNMITPAVTLALNNVLVNETFVECEVPATAESSELLTAKDIYEALDFVAASAEMLAKHTFTISLNASLTTADAAYSSVGGVKYDITGLFEYKEGPSGYPIHIDAGTVNKDGKRENVNFYISPDMYAHLNLQLKSKLAGKDSVLVDAYVFDGNPAVKDGKTSTTDGSFGKDDGLDIYLSISRIADGDKDENGNVLKHEPLKIYAPVNEIMTVVAAGAAMLDVGSLQSDNYSEDLNSAIASVADIIDQLLVDRWLPYTKDQFASLGSSLIEQFVPGGLQSVLDKIVDAVTSAEEKVGAAPQLGEKGEHAAKGYIKSISLKDGLSLKLNGATVFGEGYDDLVFTLDKETYSPSENQTSSRLTGLSLANVRTGNNYEDKFDMSAAISYGEVSLPKDLSGYYNFGNVDTLLKALVNSATHEVKTSEIISGEPAAARKEYALNNVFYINGQINLNGVLHFALNYDVADLKITLNAISVTIDKDTNDIALNLRITYPKTKAIGLVTLINDDGVADITIKGGMIYMKRVSGGETIYRAMTSEAFSSDALNQIGFLLNLGSVITDEFAKTDQSKEEKVTLKQDYGAQLATYLKMFAFDDAANKWNIVLNGSGLLSDKTMSLGDISISFGADEEKVDGETRYVINSLDLNTSLRITLTGSIYIDLNVDGALYYGNPKNEWTNTPADGNVAATAADLYSTEPSVNFSKWLNGSDKETILANNDWETLTAPSGGKYLELAFNGNSSEASALKGNSGIGTINYYISTGIANSSYEYLTSVTVLYDKTTHRIYSELDKLYPDVKAQSDEISHYTLEWQEYDFSSFDGLANLYADFKPERYTVYIYSKYKLDGNYVEMLGKYRRTLSVEYGSSLDLRYDAIFEGWRIAGFSEYSEEAPIIYTPEQLKAMKMERDITLTIVWEQIPYTVKYVVDVDGEDITVLTLDGKHYGDEIELDAEKLNLGKEQEAMLACEGYDFVGWEVVGGGSTVRGNTVVRARYAPYSRKIILKSEHEVDGWNADGDYWYYETIYTNAEYGKENNHFVLPEGEVFDEKMMLNGYKDADGKIYHFIDHIDSKEDLVLTAVWQEFAFTVTFEYTVNGETKTIRKGFMEEGDLDLSTVPVPNKTGYDGIWGYKGGQPIREDIIHVTGDTEIVAIYTPKSYQIKIYSEIEVAGWKTENGKWYSEHSYTYDTSVNLETAFASLRVSGYDFAGIYDNDSTSLHANRVQTIIVRENASYYVRWTDNTIRLNLYSEYGFDGAETSTVTHKDYSSKIYKKSLTFNDTYSLASAGEGYVAPKLTSMSADFLGWWYKAADGSWKKADVDNLKAQFTYNCNDEPYELHALWAQVSFNGSSTNTAKFGRNEYTFTAEITVKLAGDKDLLNGVALSEATIGYSANNGIGASCSGTNKASFTDMQLKVTYSDTTIYNKVKTNYSVSASFDITYGGNVIASYGTDRLTANGDYKA